MTGDPFTAADRAMVERLLVHVAADNRIRRLLAGYDWRGAEIERLRRLNEELINKLAAASEVIGRRAYREGSLGNSDTAENP